MKYDNVPLIVNEETSSFELIIDDQRSFIDFKKNQGTIYLIHTEVPSALEGKGVAASLVEKTLRYMDKHHLRLVPSCSYIQAFLKRNPEWNRLLQP